ncbi:hypothetical protein SOV_38760 [Sporomusa ovata DSM 2662]|nr:hypothetical protein SOV_3c01380 [Sporomusa ovata DSM 2662]
MKNAPDLVRFFSFSKRDSSMWVEFKELGCKIKMISY